MALLSLMLRTFRMGSVAAIKGWISCLLGFSITVDVVSQVFDCAVWSNWVSVLCLMLLRFGVIDVADSVFEGVAMSIEGLVFASGDCIGAMFCVVIVALKNHKMRRDAATDIEA